MRRHISSSCGDPSLTASTSSGDDSSNELPGGLTSDLMSSLVSNASQQINQSWDLFNRQVMVGMLLSASNNGQGAIGLSAPLFPNYASPINLYNGTQSALNPTTSIWSGLSAGANQQFQIRPAGISATVSPFSVFGAAVGSSSLMNAAAVAGPAAATPSLDPLFFSPVPFSSASVPLSSVLNGNASVQPAAGPVATPSVPVSSSLIPNVPQSPAQVRFTVRGTASRPVKSLSSAAR